MVLLLLLSWEGDYVPPPERRSTTNLGQERGVVYGKSDVPGEARVGARGAYRLTAMLAWMFCGRIGMTGALATTSLTQRASPSLK